MLSRSKKHKLTRTALVLSPLMGAVSIIPIVLFITSIPDPENQYILDPKLMAGGWFFISIAIFIQWIINIWLFGLHFKHSVVRVIASFVLSLLLISVFILIRNNLIAFRPPEIGVFKFYPFVGSLANNAFVLILIDLLVTRERRDELELERTQIERNSLQIRLDQLKHKIHPHFLFNALGNLKALITSDPELAREYVTSLSTFLRDSLKDTSKEIVFIKDEVALLENYIHLQKIRFGDSLKFEINLVKEVTEEFRVPAFTFQLLAENAIKHNGFSKENPLVITIGQLDEEGSLTFENSYLPKDPVNESTGFGVTNLKERFRYLKATEPLFEIDREEMKYRVTIFPLQV